MMLAFNLDVFLLGLNKEKAIEFLKGRSIGCHIVREDNVFPIRRPSSAKDAVKLEVDKGKVSKVHFG